MNEPPVLPNIEGMRLINGEIEHLLGLLDGDDILDHPEAAISVADPVAELRVSGPGLVAAQVFMSHWLASAADIPTLYPPLRNRPVSR